MGTPLRSRVPSMRVKRAISVFTMTGPTTGSRRTSGRSDAAARRRQAHPAREHARHHDERDQPPGVLERPLIASRISVGRGIVAPRSLKMSAKRGMTKVIRKTTAAAPTPVSITG